jgi:hypothetical protein
LENQRKDEKLPGNSYIKKEENKEKTRTDKPVAKGKEKKRTVTEKLMENLLATTKKDVRDYIIFDWAIPTFKTMIEDTVHLLLFGERSRGSIRRDRGESRIRHFPYDRSYDGDDRGRDEYIPRRSRQPELIFDTRGEAEDVLDAMYDILRDYKRVSMKDLYSLADMPTDYTMTYWGWYDLRDASVVKVREGFALKMPRAEDIRR